MEPERPVDPLVGRVVADKYEIVSLLGRGGMGAVYRARQVALDMPVAVKVLRREVATDEDFVRRFHREAKAASLLNHPCSVRVIDHGEEPDGLLYIVMEHLDGRTLHTLVDDERLDERRIALIVSNILAALARAHELGVIHRDLKPENVMILAGTDDDGRPIDVVKVCDFGIATVLAGATEGASTATTGLIMGTPQYMSPEQARGDPVDARADIYSVGAVLYELITGDPPFQAAHALGIALKLVNDPVRPPSEVARVDPELERICLKALAKRKEDRYASARDMRADLRTFLAARGSTLPPLPQVRIRVERTTPQPSAGTVADKPAKPARSRLVMAVGIGLAVSALAILSKPGGNETLQVPTAATNSAEAVVASDRAMEEMPKIAAPIASAPAPVPPAIEPAPPLHVQPKAIVFGPAHADSIASASETASAPIVAVETAVPSATAPVIEPAPVASTPPPPPPPITTAAKPFDAASATVTIGAITVSGVSSGGVRAVLSHAQFARCYRDALVAHGAAAGGDAKLRLTMDDSGRIVGATLVGASFLPAVRPCIESAAKHLTVKDVDTGDATADVVLTFKVP